MEGSPKKEKVVPSLLNLAQLIPQRDVRRLIWGTYLNPLDRKMCWLAHAKHKEKIQMSKEFLFLEDCAKYGYLDLLIYGIHNGCVLERSVISAAAFYGRLEILKWLLEQKFTLQPTVSTDAAKGGRLEILKWLQKNGFELDHHDCYDAIKYNHLDVVKWYCEDTDIISRDTDLICFFAAKYGHLRILEWAMQNYYCPKDNILRYCKHQQHIIDWIKQHEN
jgi:hypothetical protein